MVQDKTKWKKERRRRRRRTACPLSPSREAQSAPREAQSDGDFRSVPKAAQAKRPQKRSLKEYLEVESARFKAQRFRARVATQQAVRKQLPKGSVGESILRKRLGEACSACHSRRKAYDLGC